jgi:hypothetical protein
MVTDNPGRGFKINNKSNIMIAILVYVNFKKEW